MNILNSILLIITFLFSSSSFAARQSIKMGDVKLSYTTPKGWVKNKAGDNLYLIGPKSQMGYSPVVLIANTKLKNQKFDFSALKKTDEIYYLGRKLYTKKEKEKFTSKIPISYKKLRKSEWYEIGYIAKGKDYYREEMSRFLNCNNNTIQIKSLKYSKKNYLQNKKMKEIRDLISCI